MSHCWNWDCCKFPGSYKLNIWSINCFRCLIIWLEFPGTFCCLHFCLPWLSRSCLTTVFQVCLVYWKQGFHFLWKFFSWRSAYKFMCCLVSWSWSEFPSTDEVSIRSIDGFWCLVIRLKAPCAFCRLHFCLTWLCRSRLTTVFQVCLVYWKQGFHFLWKFFSWRSAYKFMCCLVSWSWSEFPSTDEVSIRSIDGFWCLVIRLKAPCAFCRLHFCLTWLCWSYLTTIRQVLIRRWKQVFHFLWKFFTWGPTHKFVDFIVK